MGCGKHVSSRQSVEIIVISSIYERTPILSIQMAAPLTIKQEIQSSDPSNNAEPLFTERENLTKPRKESIVELSKISNKEDDHLKHLTIKFRSPTEVAQKVEENNLSRGFNFDFLDESSNSNNRTQKIIDEVINDLQGINQKYH